MRIEFNDREYRFDHGCSPKGRGYWGFAFEGYEFFANGTLTEAKKQCRAEAARRAPKDYTGTVYVTILP